MSSFNKKKILYFKTIFTSTLLVAGASVIATANFSNNQNIQINSLSNELGASNSTRAISGNYEHTNYASFPTNMPQNFTQYNLFGQTNNSNFVQTNVGMLGISSDKKTFFLTSYSGRIVWAQEFASNDIVKEFYESKGWAVTDVSNVKIKEWTLFNESTKTLAVLLEDSNSHQFITLISLDTGLFIAPNNYKVDVSKAFQSLPSSDYTNISRATSNSLIVWKNNGLSGIQYFTFANNTLTLASSSTTTAETTLANKKLLSFISNDNHLFALYVENNSHTNTGNEYKYKQYLAKVSIGSNNSFSISGQKELSDYVSGSTLDLNDFKNIVYTINTNNTRQLVFITGSGTNRSLNAYSTNTTGDLTSNKELSLKGYTIASVTKGNDNKIYIANDQSTGENKFLGFVDVSQSSLSFSSIRQSTDLSTKNYYLVPVLSYSREDFFLLQDGNKNNFTFLVRSSGNYQNSTGKIQLKYWKNKQVSGKTIWNAFNKNHLASSFAWNTVSGYFDTSTLNNSNTSFTRVETDNNNGNLTFRVTFSYTSNFSLSFTESFSATFYINGLYDFNSNFVFNWLDSTSTTTKSDDQTKIQEIAKLKKSKYGHQITASDIISNFISYDIKKSDNTPLTISESMVQLTYSQYLDSITVKITIPTNGMPSGFSSSGKQTWTKTYTGFLSIQNYLTTRKSSSNISTFTNSIYPSQLTKKDILDNFLNFGSSISRDEKDWDISILNADDFKGAVSISVIYKNTSAITSFNELPNNIQNNITQIITDVSFSGFKSISSNSGWTSTPNVTDFDGTYLPSEIWGQYKAYLKGEVNQPDVILLQNISFSLTDKNNLNIICLNESSSDSDGYLDLEISIKDGSKTAVDYDGKQYKTDGGKLVFSSDFLTDSGVTYPYKIQWNIKTANKYFYLVDRKTNSRLEASNNEYKIDIKSKSPFSSSITSGFSSGIKESDIANLIDTQGYNYNISLETNVDNGYTKATIQLSLKDAPLFDYEINNSNFTRTIYIYNFNVPMSSAARITIIALSSATGVLLLVVLIWFLFWKVKLIDYFKKSYNWNKKKNQDRALQQLYKKNRFFKENLWSKKVNKK